MVEAIILTIAKLILGKIASAPGDLVYTYIAEEIKGAKSVKKDLKMIADQLEAICAVLEDSEEEQLTNNAYKIWLRDLKSIVYDIDDLLDEVAFDVMQRRVNQGQLGRQFRYYFSFSNPVISTFGLSHKISNLRKKLENIVAKKNDFELTKRPVKTSKDEPKEPLGGCAFVYEPAIKGRNEAKQDIINIFNGVNNVSKLSVLPIVGMGGIGKTALARLVINDIEHFDLKLWACVSNKFDVCKIIEDIVKDGSDDNIGNLNSNTLLKKLRNLLNEKRYFLVLDDVWVDNINLWNDLMNILKIGKAGSAILITTRMAEVASVTRTMEPYNLEKLPFPVCWSIFKRLAFIEGDEAKYDNLYEIGRSIVEKCCGIPLVVKTLGSLLRLNRDKQEWQRISNMDSFTELNHQYDKVMQLLKLSYDSLPSHLKPCFAHMSLYVKDLHLSAGYIPYMWGALGLLPQSNRNKDIEVWGNEYLKKLASMSLLQEPSFRSNGWLEGCKMHDLLHDLALNVMGEELAVVTQDEVMVSEFTRHIVWGYESSNSLEDVEFPKELLKAKSARTFRLGFKINYISQSFLQKILSTFSCLRILELEGSSFEELPSLIGNLKHLRYLDLSGNSIIQSLPEDICDLLNLEALYLDGCELLKELPRDIHRLQNLRSFTVTTCQKSLTSTKLNQLSCLRYIWFGSCKRLESLWNNNIFVTGLTSLQTFIVEDCPILTSLSNSMKFIGLQTLELDNCTELDLEEGGGLQGLQSLRILSITGIPKLASLPNCIQSATASLQNLYIINCVSLVELPNWLQHFSSLQKLRIKDCQNILAVPKGFQHLRSLQELWIMNCPHLLQRFAIPSGKDYYLIRHVPKIWLNNVPYTIRSK
ncbi:putative disease resistance protein RGA4 [Chenopodium quinoa]|uniref:Uncharacterized protein n=1 Tax=Chenopodium quinoa TaxID=63459 RepID=A0A803LA36_CHEQI|nr:putative disease resistance protein RGA4 [Chenopodium quinoa]